MSRANSNRCAKHTRCGPVPRVSPLQPVRPCARRRNRHRVPSLEPDRRDRCSRRGNPRRQKQSRRLPRPRRGSSRRRSSPRQPPPCRGPRSASRATSVRVPPSRHATRICAASRPPRHRKRPHHGPSLSRRALQRPHKNQRRALHRLYRSLHSPPHRLPHARRGRRRSRARFRAARRTRFLQSGPKARPPLQGRPLRREHR
jgi:hypothetical protein